MSHVHACVCRSSSHLVVTRAQKNRPKSDKTVESSTNMFNVISDVWKVVVVRWIERFKCVEVFSRELFVHQRHTQEHKCCEVGTKFQKNQFFKNLLNYFSDFTFSSKICKFLRCFFIIFTFEWIFDALAFFSLSKVGIWTLWCEAQAWTSWSKKTVFLLI